MKNQNTTDSTAAVSVGTGDQVSRVWEWCVESLHLLLAIWVPILCVVGVLVITVTLWIPGLILQKGGAGLLWLGSWLKDKLEDTASRFFD